MRTPPMRMKFATALKASRLATVALITGLVRFGYC